MKNFSKIIILLVVIAAGIGIGMLIYHKADISDIVNNKNNQTSDENVIGTVNGKAITASECRVYIANMHSEIEAIYGPEVWEYKLDNEGTTYDTMMKESLLEKIVYIKLVCANAEQYGVKLSSDDTVDINGYVNDFFDNITEETAKKYGVTKELVTKIYEENVLAGKVYDKITLNYDVAADKDNCRQGDFYKIEVPKCYVDSNGNTVYYSEEELKEKKTTANSIWARAKNGDFYRVAMQVSNTDPKVTVGVNKLPSAIASKVMNLSDGSMTELLETDEAYYIFYCISRYNETATDQAIQDKIKNERDAYFKKLYGYWYDNSTIDIDNEAYKGITL